jgi:uncharacterized membrane protein YGL010W
MKALELLLIEYGKSHQNKYNQLIHKVCVPLILWASLAFVYCIPVPKIFNSQVFNWGYLIVLMAFIFYIRLGVIPLVIMLFQSFIILYSLKVFSHWQLPILLIAVIVFVISWILQFIGHKIEGKRPSFLKDLQFLLIGPLWVFLRV